jgi:Patatin-like phospholipase
MLQDTHAAACTPRTFETGIVMAGAISAGAYSAGVMDFIIEALDAYEEAKKDPNWDGPTHNVRVPVLAGASAGGMTAAISALQLFHDIEHVSPTSGDPDPAANRLYSSWVSDISIEKLLETDDLSNGRVGSLLSSKVLDQIADDAFDMRGKPQTREWIGRGKDKTLKVLLTLSNLRGVPYSFKVFGQDKDLGMLNHSDYFDFTIGVEPQECAGSHVIDLSNPTEKKRDLFKNVVLATGAFPIGLLPRKISRPASDYWTARLVGFQKLNGDEFQTIPPRIANEDEPYGFLAVDGGMINNEPLEIARRYLQISSQPNTRDGLTCSKALILLAPFPHFAGIPEECSDDSILPVFGQIVSSLINQARFKPDEIKKAEDKTVFSCFMISPSKKIASGMLGGFSGFIHKSFRRHDYLLGRRDAQAFLRRCFALPETNGLFDSFCPDQRDKWYVRDGQTCRLFAEEVGGEGSAKGLPIIPLVGKLQEEIIITCEEYPTPSCIKLRLLENLVRKRTRKVVRTLAFGLKGETKTSLWGLIIREAACLWGPDIISSKANAKIREAVVSVAQAFGVQGPSDSDEKLSERLYRWLTLFRNRLAASRRWWRGGFSPGTPQYGNSSQNGSPICAGLTIPDRRGT